MSSSKYKKKKKVKNMGLKIVIEHNGDDTFIEFNSWENSLGG